MQLPPPFLCFSSLFGSLLAAPHRTTFLAPQNKPARIFLKSVDRPALLAVTPSSADGYESGSDGDDDDPSFHEDLRKAKREKLGGLIPPEQAKRAAESSENEFLAAMESTAAQFRAAKNERGVEGALDLFKRLMDEEDVTEEKTDGGEGFQ